MWETTIDTGKIKVSYTQIFTEHNHMSMFPHRIHVLMIIFLSKLRKTGNKEKHLQEKISPQPK